MFKLTNEALARGLGEQLPLMGLYGRWVRWKTSVYEMDIEINYSKDIVRMHIKMMVFGKILRLVALCKRNLDDETPTDLEEA